MHLGEAVKEAALRLSEAGVETPLLDAQLLAAYVVGCSRENVIAHPERDLTGPEASLFSSVLEKRASRYPLAYILGRKEFYGLEIAVEPGVLVPRPETELLVEECLRRVKSESPVIADVGVGSGAIAVAVAANIAGAKVYATDISDVALKVARVNVEKHSLEERVSILRGDMLGALFDIGLEFDAILSNPPYIPAGEIGSLQPEVRLYEPVEALSGGEDGLDAYRRLLPHSIELLREGGFVGVEIGQEEAGAVCKIAEQSRYRRVEVIRDLAGLERIVVAYK